jgi:hypothetical protein
MEGYFMNKIMRLTMLLVSVIVFLFILNPIMAQAGDIEIKSARFAFMHYPIQPEMDVITYPDRLTITGYINPPDGINKLMYGGHFCNPNKPPTVANDIKVTIYVNTPTPILLFKDTISTSTPLSACSKKMRYKGPATDLFNPHAEYDFVIQPYNATKSYFSISVDEEAFFYPTINKNALSMGDCTCNTTTPPDCSACDALGAPQCSAYLDFLRTIKSFDITIELDGPYDFDTWNTPVPSLVRLDTLTCDQTPSKQELRVP